ncbi:MAG TPA: universal stress protein [Chitinophagaceae bacterium]|nr:universal stress protein [Chitinophagaceae bacterium]
MKKILVPVDFSECSRLAAEFAVNLARKTSGEIYLLHVLEIEEPDQGLGSTGSWAGSEDVSTVPYMIGRLKRVKTQMNNFISENGLTGVPVNDSIEVGETSVKINDAAEKHDIDIIVMGTHGASGLKELLIGSVAEKVVQHANRPVLSIKEKRPGDPSNIIFASDFSEEAEKIFGTVNSFASIFNASLHLLKVVDRDDEDKKDESHAQLRAFAIRHHAEDNPYRILSAGKTEEGILLYSKEINADVIAIGTHGRRGLARFFNGSISGELVNHSFCPVLTVNFKMEE